MRNQLQEYIKNPNNPHYNLKLAIEYEKLGQLSSASSFYLRAAERFEDSTLVYVSLLRNALCFERLGDRYNTVKTLLQSAISVLPNRPEAYYFLSRLHENRKEYHDGYTYSCIGLVFNASPLEYLPEYVGNYLLLFEKAICGWWIGQTKESIELLKSLSTQQLDPLHRNLVQINLNRIA